MADAIEGNSYVKRPALARVLVGLFLFGVAFGYVEAAVVVYLRAVYEPIGMALDPTREVGELFPLLKVEELEAAGREHLERLGVELGREAATLLMLVAAGLMVGRNFRQWFAGFMISFGVWDIFYYVFLKVLIDWPASLLTWDLLFLLPVPWVGPVLAPVLVSVSMIAAGVILLWRERAGRPVGVRWFHWSAAIVGGLIIIVSFCWDYRHVMSGGMPNPFAWLIFAGGELLGLGAFWHAVRLQPRCRE